MRCGESHAAQKGAFCAALRIFPNLGAWMKCPFNDFSGTNLTIYWTLKISLNSAPVHPSI